MMKSRWMVVFMITFGLTVTSVKWTEAEPTSELSDAEKALMDSVPEHALLKVLSVFDEDEEKVLRTDSLPVRDVNDPGIRRLAERLLSDSRRGAYSGIAAVQVGIPRRLMVVLRRDKPDAPYEVYFNPEILEASEPSVNRESCLSMRGYYGYVERPAVIRVRYLDLKGEEITETIRGHAARTFQHEVDHLDGIMFTDRITSEEMLRRRDR